MKEIYSPGSARREIALLVGCEARRGPTTANTSAVSREARCRTQVRGDKPSSRRSEAGALDARALCLSLLARTCTVHQPEAVCAANRRAEQGAGPVLPAVSVDPARAHEPGVEVVGRRARAAGRAAQSGVIKARVDRQNKILKVKETDEGAARTLGRG